LIAWITATVGSRRGVGLPRCCFVLSSRSPRSWASVAAAPNPQGGSGVAARFPSLPRRVYRWYHNRAPRSPLVSQLVGSGNWLGGTATQAPPGPFFACTRGSARTMLTAGLALLRVRQPTAARLFFFDLDTVVVAGAVAFVTVLTITIACAVMLW